MLKWFLCIVLASSAWAEPVPPDLGVNGSLHGKLVFPQDNPWNQPINEVPVDAKSQAIIERVGEDLSVRCCFGAFWQEQPIGMAYVVVDNQTPLLYGKFRHAGSSDRGPYPVPPNPPVEDGPESTGDRHVLMVDRDNWLLYELFDYFPDSTGWFRAGSGAIFDLKTNELRPVGWPSADAAGLPIFPGLVRYDEVYEVGEIRHALRFTVPETRRGRVFPARSFASHSDDEDLPPMGMRVRLRADYDISAFPAPVQVILRALKTYGMILADNGGAWFISGTHDPRWDNDELSTLKRVKGRDLEVVQMYR